MVLTCLCVEELTAVEVLAILGVTIYYGIIGHILLVQFYKRRNYTDKLLRYTGMYLDTLEQESFLIDLQVDLQNKILSYSNMWIITENYFVGWSETEFAFHPVAIPRTEILKTNFRVSNKRFGYGKRSVSPVIICILQNGKTVELFAGGRVQIKVVWQLVQQFEGDKLVFPVPAIS